MDTAAITETKETRDLAKGKLVQCGLSIDTH